VLKESAVNLVEKALAFATAAHAAVGQVRKYTEEPYIVHPIEVRQILLKFATNPVSQNQEAAALLHDVVEDTGVTIELIREQFGDVVAELVDDLTDISKPSDGNRKFRKSLDLEHTANARPASKSIKLADLISNSRSIIKYDLNFAHVYLREKAAMLEVMKDGDPGLLAEAYRLLTECRKVLDKNSMTKD
jgi:(p)ppGpp synthase/HD superfamily hydrolase